MSTADADKPPLTAVDIAVLVAYFVALCGISYGVSRKQTKTSNSYFLAERGVAFWAVSASLFASNIGSEHFVGLAGSAAAHGISVGWFEWGAITPLLGLGYVFLPVYLASGVSTMPEYIARRYNGACKIMVVGLSLVLYIFTKISSTLFAGQLILEVVSHMDKWIAAVLLIIGTSVYTIFGGLAAVIYTEALQTGLLLFGGFLLLGFGLHEVGGFAQLRHDRPASTFKLFQPADSPDYPWTGLLTGYFVNSFWYWCCDQVIVQRALAAKNIAHGTAGCVGAAMAKTLPVFIMCVPGIIARQLMEEDGIIDPADPQADPSLYDKAYPWLIIRVMPKHTHGILIAGVMASLMSSLASVFNSGATVFAMDVYRPWARYASEATLVWVGRVMVLVLAVLSLLWLPLIPKLGDQLFTYLQKPPAYVGPAVLALFVGGVFSSIPNGIGGMITLVVGTTVGMTRFFLEVGEAAVTSGAYSSAKSDLGAFVRINFMHFAAISFVCWMGLLFLSSWTVSKLWPHYRSSNVDSPEFQSLLWKRGLRASLLMPHHYSSKLSNGPGRDGGFDGESPRLGPCAGSNVSPGHVGGDSECLVGPQPPASGMHESRKASGAPNSATGDMEGLHLFAPSLDSGSRTVDVGRLVGDTPAAGVVAAADVTDSISLSVGAASGCKTQAAASQLGVRAPTPTSAGSRQFEDKPEEFRQDAILSCASTSSGGGADAFARKGDDGFSPTVVPFEVESEFKSEAPFDPRSSPESGIGLASGSESHHWDRAASPPFGSATQSGHALSPASASSTCPLDSTSKTAAWLTHAAAVAVFTAFLVLVTVFN